jgi:hypothetical protein
MRRVTRVAVRLCAVHIVIHKYGSLNLTVFTELNDTTDHNCYMWGRIKEISLQF